MNLLITYGKDILLICCILLLIAFLLNKWFMVPIALFLAFSFYFFRNPLRSNPKADRASILSPADGLVLEVVEGEFDGFSSKISIFLSPLDVHVNSIPYSGFIENIQYKPGKFLVAFAPKSSDVNERCDVLLKTEHGTLKIRQIAGFVARRIVQWVNVGQECARGQTYGMIRFGSRVELFLPKNVKILIKKDERVYHGQTIIAEWI